MTNPKKLIDDSGEVRELTENELSNASGLSKLPDSLQAKLRTRGEQKSPTKQPVSIRLSSNVIRHFKASGRGWQSRIDDVLKSYIESK